MATGGARYRIDGNRLIGYTDGGEAGSFAGRFAFIGTTHLGVLGEPASPLRSASESAHLCLWGVHDGRAKRQNAADQNHEEERLQMRSMRSPDNDAILAGSLRAIGFLSPWILHSPSRRESPPQSFVQSAPALRTLSSVHTRGRPFQKLFHFCSVAWQGVGVADDMGQTNHGLALKQAMRVG